MDLSASSEAARVTVATEYARSALPIKSFWCFPFRCTQKALVSHNEQWIPPAASLSHQYREEREMILVILIYQIYPKTTLLVLPHRTHGASNTNQWALSKQHQPRAPSLPQPTFKCFRENIWKTSCVCPQQSSGLTANSWRGSRSWSNTLDIPSEMLLTKQQLPSYQYPLVFPGLIYFWFL